MSILELNWNQRFREKKTKLKFVAQCSGTSFTHLENMSFYVVERTRVAVMKYTNTKNASEKPAKLLFFIFKCANL